MSEISEAEIVSLSYDGGKEITLGQQKLMSVDGLSPVFQVARKAQMENMLKERPNYDTMQFTLIERATYQQARIKQREASGSYATEQNYSIANKTLNDTLNQLAKRDAELKEEEESKRQFMSVMAECVKYAISNLDATTQKDVMARLAGKYEEML